MSPTRADRRGQPVVTSAATGDPRSRLFLHAGQVFATASPTRISTVLGSCVAVCAWDPARGIGGINHFLLPHWVDSGMSSPRFGNVAVRLLVDELIDLGADVNGLRCKVFGGAHMMAGSEGREAGLGKDNVDVARKALGELGIPITAQDIGGRDGRKLIFHTDDGAAWVKKL